MGGGTIDIDQLSWRGVGVCRMTNAAHHSGSAVAHVAADGRLISADNAIRRLHQSAGGTDGGIFAVPALAAMAAATHKIRMRLARAVCVACDDENINLWVETRLCDDVAILTASGWQSAEPPLPKGVSVLAAETETETGTETHTQAEAATLPDHQASDKTAEALFIRQLGPSLRQPLGRIVANAETIGSKLHGPIRDSYALYAKDIADAARHLMALVDDLGDLEAIERPGFFTAKDTVDLSDLVRRAAGLLSLKAADQNITIETPNDTQVIAAIAEFRRVLQILINLLTNAIRYSPAGTKVTADICVVAGQAVISISDQGPGIDPSDREKIFEKFERLGRSGDGGSGLGLYISRRLARAMGGDLTVSDAEWNSAAETANHTPQETKRGGAKFTLTLPVSNAD